MHTTAFPDFLKGKWSSFGSLTQGQLKIRVSIALELHMALSQTLISQTYATHTEL